MRGDAVLSESCVRILKPCREVRSMTSRPPTNVPASVHQRLLNLARQTNRPFNELLQYFAIQRFLFRFSRSAYAEQFVLKGAQMLQAWDAPLARPTMDIDMLGRVSNTVENLEQIVRACATVEVDADGVEFDPQSGIRCRRETFTVWSSRAGDGTVNKRHMSSRIAGSAFMEFAGAR